ncbi:MAG TPA: DMT family transporter [Actinomycetota bacterium]|nr:DMT family transporter [Actinomycetota bacterium]
MSSQRQAVPGWLGARPGVTALGGALCIAFSGILVRLADVTPDTAAVFRCLLAVPVLGLLASSERRSFGPRTTRDRALAVAAGVFFALDLAFWHRSIQSVGAGLATVLGNLQVVFVALAAWAILGERPGRLILAAIPVALSGIVLISGVLEDAAFGRDPVGGVMFGILTSLAYTGFILVLRRGNQDLRRPAGPLFDATATSAVVGTGIGLSLGTLDPTPGWPAFGWLVALALTSQVVGWLLISVTLPRLPAAVTSMLLTVQPVGAVLLAMLILSESPSALQLLGVVLVLAGVVAVGISRRRTVPTAVPEPAG